MRTLVEPAGLALSRRGLVLAAFAICTAAGAAAAQTPVSPDAALQRVVAAARAEALQPGACARPGLDRLTRIYCQQELRIGVREFYPLFGTAEDGERRGYDVDVGRAVGERLGVPVAFVRVNAASRISALAADQVDVTIATMGHNTQRDGEARFVRPHYYQSETTLVGPRTLEIYDWGDTAGRTICVTVGNGSNAQIVSQGARLMLFEEAGSLIARLRDGTCPLAAQDDSFFAYHFTDPDFAARFDRKFGFARVPWGMAVARAGSDGLATALAHIGQILHRDGVFLDMARRNKIGTAFLDAQREVWNRPECNRDTGPSSSACVLPPLDTAFEPTSFAPQVRSLETYLSDTVGLSIALPMFQLAPAWSLFTAGVANSLILVAGALVATLAFALLMGWALGSERRIVRLPARAVTITMQSSPVVLTLVIAAAIAHALFPYSGTIALGAAMIALGLTNGSNAGQAIAEAMRSVRAERGDRGSEAVFEAALSRASTQIISFLVNAAKGTPVASFIGAPELLGALTDVTSFSASGRGTTYTLVLIFYIAVISVVVWLCGHLQAYLARRQVAA